MLKLIGFLALMGLSFYAGTQYQKNKPIRQQVKTVMERFR